MSGSPNWGHVSPRPGNRSAKPVSTWEWANRTLALSTASTGRCPCAGRVPGPDRLAVRRCLPDGRNAGYRGARTLTRPGKRSAKPVWACGWSSQTRRRRPEESVQTDQRSLRGQCDLRGSATLVRGLFRFSLLRPRNAFDSTARVGRSARRAGHLVQQPGCTPRPRRRGLHERSRSARGRPENRALSLSDDDGRATAYRLRRTVTRPVSVRSSRYPALRPSGKHRRTAS